MDFATISKLVIDAGVSLACSAVMIFVFYKLIDKHMKDEETLRNAQNEQNKKLLEHILEYTPYAITPKKYDENVAIDKEINSILTKLKDSLNPTRTYLVTFHNGGKDLSGLSFLKMSMRNEVTSPNIKPLQPEFQSIFRNTFAYWCNEISEKGQCYIKNIDEVKDKDSSLYDFMSIRDITSLYGKAVRNKDGHIIGFIGVEYMSKPTVTMERIEHCLTDKKNKVEALLNLVRNNEEKGD